MGQTLSLDHEFLRRVQVTSLVAGLVGAVFVGLYSSLPSMAAWLSGIGLSIVNLQLLTTILRRVLRPDPNVGMKLALALLLKLPLVFGVLFLAVGVLKLPLLWFSLGFFLLFAVLVLKVTSSLMLSKMGVTVTDKKPFRGPREARTTGSGERGGSSGNGDSTFENVDEASPGKRDAKSSRAKMIGTSTALLVLIGLMTFGVGLPSFDASHDDWTTTIDVDTDGAVAHAQTDHDDHSGHDHGDHDDVSDDDHSGAAGEHDAHGKDHDDHGPVKHFPNLVTYAVALLENVGAPPAIAAFLLKWENLIFSLLVAAIFGVVTAKAASRREMIPGKLQNFVEYAVEGYYNFVRSVLGDEARRYIPFVGTLFFYIWGMNWMGLVPGFKSPTAYLNTTAALAICVFLYTQYVGVTRLGPVKYLLHLAGDPKDALGWGMVPLMLPLHIVGEIAKPVSLSLRLFGNIMGEDTLLALFAMLLIIPLGFVSVGFPFHLPFMFLALLASTIQALVFSLLATIYISLMLPHEEH